MSGSTPLRTLKSEIVSADTPAALKTALNAFFQPAQSVDVQGTADQRKFVQILHVAALTVLIVYTTS